MKFNPSDQENFYELTEEVIEDIVNEKEIEKIKRDSKPQEEIKKIKMEESQDDPYSDILKEV